MISKLSSTLLILAGVFNVIVWPRFARAIAADDRSWSGEHWASTPQSFFWVHAVLIITAMTLGITVLIIGIRALRSQRITAVSA